MRSFKKMTAVVMAVATLATSMVPFSADALYYNENSKFTYDLAVESESDDMIKVTFYTTYNPGTAAISMALKYDEKNLECVKSDMDIFYHSETLNGMNTNARNGMAIAAAATISGAYWQEDEGDVVQDHDYPGENALYCMDFQGDMKKVG